MTVVNVKSGTVMGTLLNVDRSSQTQCLIYNQETRAARGNVRVKRILTELSKAKAILKTWKIPRQQWVRMSHV